MNDRRRRPSQPADLAPAPQPAPPARYTPPGAVPASPAPPLQQPVQPAPAPPAPAQPTAPARQWPHGSKLHVGCGPRHLAGWQNTDCKSGIGPDGVVVLGQTALPARTFSAVYGCHVLEHCFPEETPAILASVYQALVPGGTLRLSVPDLRKILRGCDEAEPGSPEYFGADLNAPLFGDYRRVAEGPDRHRQAFTRRRLTALLQAAGFANVREWTPEQYPEIAAVRDWSSWPAISLNLEGDRPSAAGPEPERDGRVHVSAILGTVDRPEALRRCVESLRASAALLPGLSLEIVVAYGTPTEVSLPWMREQPDVRPVLAGLDGAIPAFNLAYRSSRGEVVLQLNDDVEVELATVPAVWRHLQEHPDCDAVCLYFDRDDGQGRRVLKMGQGALHCNQVAIRRLSAEAVVEGLGEFWGDAAHRSDRTYGGDSGLSAFLWHRGMRVDLVPEAGCRDRCDDPAYADGLRQRNLAIVKANTDHGENWKRIFAPLLAAVVEPGPDEWPHVYVPVPGRQPRRSPIEAGPPERLLHLCGRTAYDTLARHREAFAQVGPTVELPWHEIRRSSGADEMARSILEAVDAHRPTLVWMQVQAAGVFPPELAREIRRRAPAGCMLLNWSGDVRKGATQPPADWQVQLGRELDLSLDDDCTEPHRLKKAGVPATGYLQCGYDEIEFYPGAPDPGDVPASAGVAVFTGANYEWLDGGVRERLAQHVAAAAPGMFRVHGFGWKKASLPAEAVGTHLSRPQCAALYQQAAAVVCQSLYNGSPDALARYTSDRLRRVMGAGGLALVQRFPDLAGLGLRDGENCLVWESAEELAKLIRAVVAGGRAGSESIRRAAAELARAQWTWPVVVENLLAIVREERRRRARR